MSDDLKLVQQLEKETGIRLERFSMKEIGQLPVTCFAADNNGRVQGLAIYSKKLHRLPELLSKFQRLEKLILEKNQINDISNLKELKGLTSLNLSDNQISDISSLKELKGLTYLNLYNNQISDISSLKELKNLKRLFLQKNKIIHMPAEFLDLGPVIKWVIDLGDGIFLGDNPLESPPVEIIKKGNEAIRQYFKSLAGEQQALKFPFDKIDKELFFICYSRRDEDFVLHLCKKLKEVGVKIWLDQWDIAPGDNWNKSIDEALYKCNRMLIILSPEAVDSDEVQSELYTFFKEKKPVFPIAYRDCRIPRRLNVIQHINFTSSDLGNKNKIAELVKIITK